jgi:lysozyme
MNVFRVPTPTAPTLQVGAQTEIQMSAILPVPNALLGIDVSHYQGSIDWVKVAESGVKFAFIKATEGNSITDPALKQNAQGAAAAGVPFGFYHVWRPGLLDQKAHFNHQCIELLAVGISPLLPDILDIEPGTISEDTQVAALTFDPGIVYVAPSEAQVYLTDPAWLSYPLWIAHYTEAPRPNTVKWPNWTFWQRQSDGEVPGITTPVDIDWFNGSEEDFQRLIVPT